MEEILTIGFRGEKNARSYDIDISDLIAKWPTCSPSLLVKRSKDTEPYFAVTTLNNGILHWVFTEVETEYSGYGKFFVEMASADGNVIGKSKEYPFYCASSMTGGTTIPEAMEPWYNSMAALKAEIDESYQTAISDISSKKTDAIDAITDLVDESKKSISEMIADGTATYTTDKEELQRITSEGVASIKSEGESQKTAIQALGVEAQDTYNEVVTYCNNEEAGLAKLIDSGLTSIKETASSSEYDLYNSAQQYDKQLYSRYTDIQATAIVSTNKINTATTESIASVNKAKNDAIADVEEKIASGEYKGEKGDPGPQGEKGDTGDSGVAYSTTEPEDASVDVWINPEEDSSISQILTDIDNTIGEFKDWESSEKIDIAKFRDEAKQSETNAKTSEENAKSYAESAQSAQEYASEAKQSAEAAQASADGVSKCNITVKKDGDVTTIMTTDRDGNVTSVEITAIASAEEVEW